MSFFSSCKKEYAYDKQPSREIIESYLDSHGDKYIKEYLDKKNPKEYIKNHSKNYGFAFIEISSLEKFIELNENFEICNLDQSLFAIPRSTIKDGEADMRRHLYWEELYYVKRNPEVKEFLDTHVLVMKKLKDKKVKQ